MSLHLQSRDTEYRQKVIKLSQVGGQLYRDILSKISAKELLDLYKSADKELKKRAAEVLVEKYDGEYGVTKAWLNKNKKNYFEWAEASILGNKKDGSDGLGYKKLGLVEKYIEVKNFKRAIELLKQVLAMRFGLSAGKQAALSLGQLYSEGEIQASGIKAKKYFEIGIKKYRDPEAMIELARLYLRGEIVKQNKRQVYLLANKACRKAPEFLDGKELLADCYFYGWGTNKNKPKANKLFIEIGLDYSDYHTIKIAEAYIDGIGVKKNVAKAIKILRQSVKEGSAEAAYILGRIYAYGTEMKENYKKAYEYFQMAAKSKNPDIRSYVQLGIMYLHGFGIDKNRRKAKSWFQKAYNQEEDIDVQLNSEYFLEKEFGLVGTFSEVDALTKK